MMLAYEAISCTASLYKNAETRAMLAETFRKMYKYFSDHNSILISVSGGSDSDCIVHMICKYFPEFVEKCHFVFVDTGLEFDATKRHLCEMETRYGIHIEKIRGLSVVTSCRKYGFPILSKFKSQALNAYLRGLPWGIKAIEYESEKSFHSMQFTEKQKRLAAYLKYRNIMVSAKCCDISKKEPIHKYITGNSIDLNVTGERKDEGGVRSFSHKSCFEEGTGRRKYAKYMPLFFWSDAVKAEFKTAERITYSDCYEVYGMKRTGCCGCPFNPNVKNDLEIMRQYEPKLFRVVMNVFGRAYAITDAFKAKKKKCMPEGLDIVSYL